MRPTKLQSAMATAEIAALNSHDLETKVGAVLVKESSGAIIATGYNGFVRSAPDGDLPNTRPDKYPYMMHAEVNLIANCARHGIAMEGSFLVCTHTPCQSCMRQLYQAGITRVIAKNKYRDFEQLTQMQDLRVLEYVTDVEDYVELLCWY